MSAERTLDDLIAGIRQSGDGCWIWPRPPRPNGYGAFRNRQAHRAVYQRLRGPIPDVLVLDHLCRVRLCVNPDHLEPVTNRTNILRGVSPAAVRARQTACKEGHPFTEANTYIYNGGRYCRTCRAAKRAAYNAARRQAVSVLPHPGSSSCYGNGCRAELCRAARREDRRRRRSAA